MRWLFVFLVFINLFFAIWVSQQPTSHSIQNQQPTTTQQVATITLLSEAPEQAKKAILPEDNQPTPEQEPIKEPITCLYIGGVTKQTSLNPISSFLKKQNEAIDLPTVKLDKAPRIRLYIDITPITDKKDLFEQLNQLSINYMTIARGPLKNNINLGAFIEEKDYSLLNEELKKADIEVKTKTLPNASSSLWLKVLPEQSPLLTEQLLTSLLNKIPSAQQELMRCDLSVTN